MSFGINVKTVCPILYVEFKNDDGGMKIHCIKGMTLLMFYMHNHCM